MDSTDTTQINSHIRAGSTATIQSGGDMVLNGAVVSGNKVVADVGGDLVIGSQQDTGSFTSHQSSTGGGVSLCLPPLCYGSSSVSASAGKQDIDSHYASVNEQSAIRAGDGGFQVNVKGGTTLNGGAITSTQKAIDDSANAFHSAKGVTTSDIQNSASYKGDGYSISASLGFKAGDQSAEATKNLSKEQQAAAAAKPVNGGSFGVGKDNGSASSVTRSGISGIAGDTDRPDRAADCGHGLPRPDQRSVGRDRWNDRRRCGRRNRWCCPRLQCHDQQLPERGGPEEQEAG
jgi:filamentous hemagglutinin